MFGSDIIRVKVKGFLRNITENDNIFFDEKGILNNNKINFICDNVKYSIKYSNSEVMVIREGNDFINTFIFNMKKSISSYTLKDNNYTIEMNVKVENINIGNDYIYVKYIIIDTDCVYEYKIEMSEIL